jgi:hypothetical protein
MLLRAVGSSLLLILTLAVLGVVLLVVRVSSATVVWKTASEVGTACGADTGRGAEFVAQGETLVSRASQHPDGWCACGEL